MNWDFFGGASQIAHILWHVIQVLTFPLCQPLLAVTAAHADAETDIDIHVDETDADTDIDIHADAYLQKTGDAGDIITANFFGFSAKF